MTYTTETGIQKMNAIQNKIKSMSASEIKDIISSLARDERDEAGIVLEAALDVLERKIREKEFIEFCDSI
jgi:hypothetical protein